jgi:uncharacterized membrane-anchored protein
MKTKYILLATFLIVVAAQLYVPASMIMDQEETIATGKTYRFETRPIDPNDPFRGKFVFLDYKEESFTLPDSVNFSYNEEVYVRIYEDERGFAKISDVTKESPGQDVDYVQATVSYPNYYNDSTRLTINYPFNRFYMEEYKAPEAEKIYFESQRDSLKTSWAVVKIKEGNAVLEDVMIDGTSIADIVKAQQNN